jgi:hypothetical protein
MNQRRRRKVPPFFVLARGFLTASEQSANIVALLVLCALLNANTADRLLTPMANTFICVR